MYQVLNIFFIAFHSLFVLFCVTGWMWKKTRKLNLVLLLLTGFSWFILGIWYGIGYCPFTDWHWQVRHKLGHHDMPYSYMKFLLETVTGLEFNALFVDYMTVIFFTVALIMSCATNIIDWYKNRGMVK